MCEEQIGKGDRVQDLVWDGRFTGLVRQVFDDGTFEVQWDGNTITADQMAPHQVRLLRKAAA